jgi:hypothetical protein
MSNSPNGARHPRVAVDVLQRDQRAVLFEGDPTRSPPITPITEPFETRQALINWWQATCVRTFGHLRYVYPPRAVVGDEALTKALTADDAGPTATTYDTGSIATATPASGTPMHDGMTVSVSGGPAMRPATESRPTGSAQKRTRKRLQERVVSACSTAYRDLETRANEWLADSNNTDSDWTQINPETQRHVAMRPAFSRLDDEQSSALQQLWGGFDDRAMLMEWTHGLPAVADFARVLDTDVTTALVKDDNAIGMLTDQRSETADVWRETFAATILLPAFATRATKLQAGERAEATRSEQSAHHG